MRTLAAALLLLTACRAACAQDAERRPVELPLSTAALSGGATFYREPPARDNILHFCETLRQLLAPPPAEKGKLPPRPPDGFAPGRRERLRLAEEKEKQALKVCDASLAQREAAGRREAAAALKGPSGGRADALVAENLRRMADALEQTAIVLYLDAYALRTRGSAD